MHRNARKVKKLKEQLLPLIGQRIRIKATNGWFSAVLIGVTKDGPVFETGSFRRETDENSKPDDSEAGNSDVAKC